MANPELLSNFETAFPSAVTSSPTLWIGATSFEERCLSSVRRLDALGLLPELLVVLDYSSVVRPVEQGERIRAKNKQAFAKMAGNTRKAEFHVLHSYHPGPFLQLLETRLAGKTNGTAIIDVTCLTKMHTLALADWLVNDAGIDRCIIAYSLPDQYLSPSRYLSPGGKWTEVVVSPLRFSPMSYQRYSNGVILSGHDGGRLLLALDELEVSDALVLITDSPGQEQLTLVERTRNLWLHKEIESGTLRHWTIQRVSITDSALVQQLVAHMADRSTKDDRRLALFPFGPKPVLFSAAVAATSSCPERIWYSYPIPVSYQLDYTLGGGVTFWSTFQKNGQILGR